MDEQSIRLRAAEAIKDLELDCEVREVCRSPDGEEWCVQFTGSYSQLCDRFQDQFERDNSLSVVRQKIKRHLLKQVDKIRRSAGKFRRARAKPADAPLSESNLLSAPLKMIGDALATATELAGGVIEQAAGVADAARRTVANMSDEIVPVKVEIKSSSSTEARKTRKSPARKAVKTKKAQTKRAVKAARKASGRAGKRAKKAGKAVAKTGGKARKTGVKRKR